MIDKAIRLRRPGPYQIPAAIAAPHARDARSEDTDCGQIDRLYATFEVLQPSPVVTLNRASPSPRRAPQRKRPAPYRKRRSRRRQTHPTKVHGRDRPRDDHHVALFLAMDLTMTLMDLEVVRQARTQLGYPASLERVIGIIELVRLVLYLIQRMAVLGAIRLSGPLGGAVASPY